MNIPNFLQSTESNQEVPEWSYSRHWRCVASHWVGFAIVYTRIYRCTQTCLSTNMRRCVKPCMQNASTYHVAAQAYYNQHPDPGCYMKTGDTSRFMHMQVRWTSQYIVFVMHILTQGHLIRWTRCLACLTFSGQPLSLEHLIVRPIRSTYGGGDISRTHWASSHTDSVVCLSPTFRNIFLNIHTLGHTHTHTA